MKELPVLSKRIECHLRRLAVCLIALAATPAFAGKDTPEGMMGVVQQEGVPSASDMQAAASEMNAFYSRLATDKAYAAQLLAAIQKNDRAGITTLLKAAMSKTTITLGKVNPDFHVDMSLSIGHYKWSSCFSSDHSCDGHNVTLG